MHVQLKNLQDKGLPFSARPRKGSFHCSAQLCGLRVSDTELREVVVGSASRLQWEGTLSRSQKIALLNAWLFLFVAGPFH